MLTKSDLKAIKDIIDGSLNNRVAPLESRFGTLESRFGTLESRFGTLESRFGTLESRFGRMEKRVDKIHGSMKWWFKRFQRTDNEILHYVDTEHGRLKHRVSRLEQHVGLPVLN